jgi:hypothetical protein
LGYWWKFHINTIITEKQVEFTSLPLSIYNHSQRVHMVLCHHHNYGREWDLQTLLQVYATQINFGVEFNLQCRVLHSRIETLLSPNSFIYLFKLNVLLCTKRERKIVVIFFCISSCSQSILVNCIDGNNFPTFCKPYSSFTYF